MTSKELFNLTQDLVEIIEIAKIEARSIKMPNCEKEFRFVHCGDKEYINPKYISFEAQCQIIQLGKFVKMYPTITNEDLAMILIENRSNCGIMLDAFNTIPNFVEEARSHKEEKHLLFLYFGIKQTIEKENNLSY